MTTADAVQLQRGDLVKLTSLGIRSRIGHISMLTVGRVDDVELAMDNGREQPAYVHVYFGSIHGIVRLSCYQLERK